MKIILNQEYSIYIRNGCSNNITGNIITSTYNYGIYLYESSNNNISNNTITSNNWYGISLWDSSNNNIIYHNNFVNNIVNARDFCSNTWDDGYPSGGNYWDDYTGEDTNGDGIGETPYIIPGSKGNQDKPREKRKRT